MLFHYVKKHDLTLQKVVDALLSISAWEITAAAVLTLLNYVILVGYDWLAVRWVGEKDLPLRKIAMASFTGYAFSYNFGATLFGTSIRYRLYSAWGVTARKILDLLVILGLTFWFGVFTLAGIIFVVTPFPIPVELKHLKIPISGNLLGRRGAAGHRRRIRGPQRLASQADQDFPLAVSACRR